jgi:ketosteroid isomerase-like protein
MSREDVEVVRAIWEAFSRFEFPAEAFAEDVEWQTASDLPDPEICKGVPAIQRMLAEGWGTVTDPACEVEELVDAGDSVVVRWRGSGRGRASDVPMEWREAHTYVVRDGKVVEVREFRNWPDALDAAGLSE